MKLRLNLKLKPRNCDLGRLTFAGRNLLQSVKFSKIRYIWLLIMLLFSDVVLE